MSNQLVPDSSPIWPLLWVQIKENNIYIKNIKSNQIELKKVIEIKVVGIKYESFLWSAALKVLAFKRFQRGVR